MLLPVRSGVAIELDETVTTPCLPVTKPSPDTFINSLSLGKEYLNLQDCNSRRLALVKKIEAHNKSLREKD